jgi:hypothetical protein
MCRDRRGLSPRKRGTDDQDEEVKSTHAPRYNSERTFSSVSRSR